MKKIDKAEYQERLDRIQKLFAGMVNHAGEISLKRCPYKNRFDQCTAKFGCEYQRRTKNPDDLLSCVSDDKLDYRSAWEMDPSDLPRTKSSSEEEPEKS
jgi:hypothetical protein